MSYNPDFTRNARGQFNIDNSFLSIKNGGEAYLLEDELNEMQWVQNELRAQTMRSIVNSGFLYNTLQILDINATSNEKVYTKSYGNADLNTNALLFNIENYVPININGYFFKLAGTYRKTITGADTPNNNILINLPSPPTASNRYDLVYLEVWFEELNINNNSGIKYFGGADNSNISTFSADNRLNVETTRRVQLKWAIRTVTGTEVIINSIKPRGINTNVGYVRANTTKDQTYSKDNNLFISKGNTDNVAIDGLYYAIPLISLYRIVGQTTISASNCLQRMPMAQLAISSLGSDKLILGKNDKDDIAIINNAGNLEVKKDKTDEFTGLTIDWLVLNDNAGSNHATKFSNNRGVVELKYPNDIYADLAVGNLIVKGATTTVSSETVTIADNIIVLNSNVTSKTDPNEDAGVEIERGSATNSRILWDEGNDVWKAGLVGSEDVVLLRTNPNISGTLTIEGSAEKQLILKSTDNNNTHVISVTNKTNNELSNITFDGDGNNMWKIKTNSERNIAVIDPTTNIISDTEGKNAKAFTADKLATIRTITIDGSSQGSVSFDGSQNVTITTKTQRGNDSSKPAAAASNVGEIYIATDTKIVYICVLSSSTYKWQAIAGEKVDWSNVLSKPTKVSDTDANFHYDAVAPTGSTRLNYNGHLYATRVYNAVFNDYAEYFEKGQNAEPGDVVMCDEDGDKYVKSNSEYSKLVVGVYSDTYGHLLGGNGNDDDEENFMPIGLSGRVNVKVVGEVKKGDLLVSSHIPGVAMRAEQHIPGTIIGKALQNHIGTNVDRINMLICNM